MTNRTRRGTVALITVICLGIGIAVARDTDTPATAAGSTITSDAPAVRLPFAYQDQVLATARPMTITEVVSWIWLISDRNWHGGSYLPLDPTLNSYAQRHANVLASADNGLWHQELAVEGGLLWSGWRSAGENVAYAGGGDVWGAFSAIAWSPPHHQNIVGDWDAVGVAVANGPSGKTYLVQVFGLVNR